MKDKYKKKKKVILTKKHHSLWIIGGHEPTNEMYQKKKIQIQINFVRYHHNLMEESEKIQTHKPLSVRKVGIK